VTLSCPVKGTLFKMDVDFYNTISKN